MENGKKYKASDPVIQLGEMLSFLRRDEWRNIYNILFLLAGRSEVLDKPLHDRKSWKSTFHARTNARIVSSIKHIERF